MAQEDSELLKRSEAFLQACAALLHSDERLARVLVESLLDRVPDMKMRQFAQLVALEQEHLRAKAEASEVMNVLHDHMLRAWFDEDGVLRVGPASKITPELRVLITLRRRDIVNHIAGHVAYPMKVIHFARDKTTWTEAPDEEVTRYSFVDESKPPVRVAEEVKESA